MAERASLRKYLEEGKEHIRRNDPVQANEKLYKAAEEAVKVISEPLMWAVARESRWHL